MRSNRWTTLLQNQVVAIVLALLLAVPVLFAVPNLRRVDQVTVYGLLGVLLLAVWLFRAQNRITLDKVRAMALGGPNLPVLLYVGWTALCVALSSQPALSQMALVQMAVGVLVYWMVVYHFRQKSQVQSLLSCLLVIGVLLVLGALATDRNRLTSLAGSFHDRQLFGAFLGLLLPVGIGVAAGTKSRVWKLAAQLSSVLMAVGLLLTQCRSAWLGAVVALVCFVALSVLFVWKSEQLARNKHKLLIAPALAAAALAAFLLLNPQSASQLGNRAATIPNASQDDSVKDRYQLWGVAKEMVAARPVTGFGPGAYALAQVPFNPNSRHESLIRQFGTSLSESPHNTYLQIAAETGIPGLLFFLGIIGMFFVTGIRALPRMDRGLRQYTLIGCLAAVAGASVDAIANPGYMFPEVTTFFWLVLGIGMCAAGLGHQVAEETVEVREEASSRGMSPFLNRVLRTAAIGCGTLFLGSTMLNLNGASAASAGSRIPIYCEVIDSLEVDFLNDNFFGNTIGNLVGADNNQNGLFNGLPPGVFEFFNGTKGLPLGFTTDIGVVRQGEAARFKVYAIDAELVAGGVNPVTDNDPNNDGIPGDPTMPFEPFAQFADVTSERKAIRVTSGGIGAFIKFRRSFEPQGGYEILVQTKFRTPPTIDRPDLGTGIVLGAPYVITFTYDCGPVGQFTTVFLLHVSPRFPLPVSGTPVPPDGWGPFDFLPRRDIWRGLDRGNDRVILGP